VVEVEVLEAEVVVSTHASVVIALASVLIALVDIDSELSVGREVNGD